MGFIDLLGSNITPTLPVIIAEIANILAIAFSLLCLFQNEIRPLSCTRRLLRYLGIHLIYVLHVNICREPVNLRMKSGLFKVLLNCCEFLLSLHQFSDVIDIVVVRIETLERDH